MKIVRYERENLQVFYIVKYQLFMSVKGVSAFDEERQRVRGEYRIVRDFSLISEERLRFFCDFGGKVGAIYNKLGGNSRINFSIDSLTSKDPSSIICGFPGQQRDTFKQLLNSFSQVFAEITSMSKFATAYLQKDMQEQLQRHESKRREIVEGVHKLGDARRKMRRDLENAQASNRKLVDQVRKGYADFERAKSRNQEKSIDSAKSKLSKLVVSLVASNRDVSRRIAQFNDMNREYLNNLVLATKNLKELEVSTLRWLINFFKPFGETMTLHGLSSKDTSAMLERIPNASHDLQSFMLTNKIFRTVVRDFGSFRVGPVVEGVARAIVPAVPTMNAYPVAIGKALTNFQTTEPRELGFKKGDWIALLELPTNDQWCLAYVGGLKNKLGYVPSRAVEVSSVCTGICTCHYFGVGENELCVSVGDIVIVHKESNQIEDEDVSLEMRIPIPKYGDDEEASEINYQALSPRSKADVAKGDLLFCETLSGTRGWLPKYVVLCD